MSSPDRLRNLALAALILAGGGGAIGYKVIQDENAKSRAAVAAAKTTEASDPETINTVNLLTPSFTATLRAHTPTEIAQIWPSPTAAKTETPAPPTVTSTATATEISPTPTKAATIAPTREAATVNTETNLKISGLYKGDLIGEDGNKDGTILVYRVSDAKTIALVTSRKLLNSCTTQQAKQFQSQKGYELAGKYEFNRWGYNNIFKPSSGIGTINFAIINGQLRGEYKRSQTADCPSLNSKFTATFDDLGLKLLADEWNEASHFLFNNTNSGFRSTEAALSNIEFQCDCKLPR